MIDVSWVPSEERLRQRLDQITAGSQDRVTQHPDLVVELRSAHAHTIDVAQDDAVAELHLDRYNCFEYAFGLAGSQTVIRIASALASVYACGDFVSFLIGNHLSEIPAADALHGDVVVYFAGPIVSHAGKAVSGQVVSKWGTGHLWKHRVFEVPARYGDCVRFYRPIPKHAAEDAFVAYARAREGAALIDELLKE